MCMVVGQFVLTPLLQNVARLSAPVIGMFEIKAVFMGYIPPLAMPLPVITPSEYVLKEM